MKTKGVFLGLESRGKFGSIAVASMLRGIQIIKAKKDPANPRTQKQKNQRAIYRAGKLYYREVRLTERDKTALSRQARLAQYKLNPFQMFMMIYMGAIKWTGEYYHARNAISNSPSKGDLYVSCEYRTGATLYVGINRRFDQRFILYPISEIGGSGKYEGDIHDLLVGEKYYFIFYILHPVIGIIAISGVYFQWI